ncbi:MAG: T9SS type A sorting domain-containing protein [Hymenobacter sp.]|nr:MAG: T9SS type A sorting domain-containing protein [Hymenobacter sp.]
MAASFGATQLAAAGSGVAKLIDAGPTSSFGWVQPVVAATFSRLAVGNGRLYATGRILGTATFGSTALTSTSGGSSFVAALTDGGSTAGFGWAQQLGDPTGNTAIHTVAASGGAVYVAGVQRGALSFGSTTLPAPVDVGLFVARLTDAGPTASYAWAVPAKAYFSAYAHSLALYKSTLYLTGMLAGPVEFGTTSLPASGGPVAYLASLADETALAATPAAALAGLEVSPNPAHNTVLVRVPAGAGAAALTLLDALGRTVRTQTAPAGLTSSLDLAGLTPGMYALRVQVGEGQAVRQLVVE